ncbi:hypothetical protein ACET3Z_001489 [Daucus carota]
MDSSKRGILCTAASKRDTRQSLTGTFIISSVRPNTKGINYDGNATASNPGIQLTLNQNDRGLNQSSGLATYFEAMHLWDNKSGSIADFSSNFSFKIDSRGLSNYSDGMTFFLAPVGFTMPRKQQGAGLGLVYVDQNFNSSLIQFVAVEFDTHANLDYPVDPPYDHVGIDISSMTSVKTMRWRNRIPDGFMNEAWISYSSSAKNLTVSFTSFVDSEPSIESLWDIKSSNVMLDSDFNAKLGDFGLARLVDHGKEIETTLIAGTMGYMAPEYVMTGRASKETDVYSFGIVALEIASGRHPINSKGKQGEVLLVEYIWQLYGQEKILEAADPKLSSDFDDKELTRLLIVGLWCAHPDHKLRPSIRQAIQVLNFEVPLPRLSSTMPALNYSTTTSTYSDSHTGSTSVFSN